jgi:hypothetical protein
MASVRRELLLHLARPRPERLPFVEDRFQTAVAGLVEGMDSLLKQQKLRLGPSRGGGASPLLEAAVHLLPESPNQSIDEAP